MVKRYGVRSRVVRSSACPRAPSSRSRPTSRGSPPRPPGGATGRTPSSRHAAGCSTPRTPVTGRARRRSRRRRRVASAIRISCGRASPCRWIAASIAAPASPAGPADASPASTSPVATAARSARLTPSSRSSSRLAAATVRRASRAARTARSGSSSWTAGMPKTARIAPPIARSTAAPCRSSASDMSSSVRVSGSCSTSGSSGGLSGTISAVTTETVFRTSRNRCEVGRFRSSPPAGSSSSAGSWSKIARCRRWSAGLGSIPTSSTSRRRVSW